MRSDPELIELINNGSVDAFEALYHKYRQWVYDLAYRFTGREDLALDVLQETFIYLLKKFPGFELHAKLTTFLYPAVKHISLNISKKYPPIADPSIPVEIQTCESNSPDQVRTELAQAMNSLPIELREIILMRFVDDLSLNEIAAALEMNLNTVKSKLYRALEALRQNESIKNYFLE